MQLVRLLTGLNVSVKRATSLFNSFFSNVSRQVARFLLPVFPYLYGQLNSVLFVFCLLHFQTPYVRLILCLDKKVVCSHINYTLLGMLCIYVLVKTVKQLFLRLSQSHAHPCGFVSLCLRVYCFPDLLIEFKEVNLVWILLILSSNPGQTSLG